MAISKKIWQCIRKNWLTLAIFIGVVSGVLLGISLRALRDGHWSMRDSMYVSFIGEIFLNMLKCIILPLIIPSVIVSIGSMDFSLSKKVAFHSVAYYLLTTLCAVALGIVLVTTIKPGEGADNISEYDMKKNNVTTPDILLDLVRNFFPPNIVRATVAQQKTELIYPGDEAIEDEKTGAMILPGDKDTWLFHTHWTDNTNFLGLIVFSIVVGIAIALSGPSGKPFLDFFESFSFVSMKIATWIIHLSPFGLCFLIAGRIVGIKDLADQFSRLGWYFFTVILGLLIHAFIVLPLFYTIITRRLPFRFILNLTNPLLTAFGTASSSATLPMTINALEENNNISPRVTRFILPIGATINMDGTALYEAVAALFIAQTAGLEPSPMEVIAIAFTATAASMGAAGIPEAGIVTMVMVLDTLGLPAEGVALILSIDWLLDRCRTAVNVLGDSIGAGIVDHLNRNSL